MKLYCGEVKNLLPLYMDDMTNQIETEAIKEHLEVCAECRQELEFYKAIAKTASQMPEIEVSDNFNKKLQAKLIEAKNSNRANFLKQFKRISVSFATAAAVIAISVVSLNVLNDKDVNTGFNEPIQTSSPADNFPSEKPKETTETKKSDDLSLSASISDAIQTSAPEESKNDAEAKKSENENIKQNTPANNQVPQDAQAPKELPKKETDNKVQADDSKNSTVQSNQSSSDSQPKQQTKIYKAESEEKSNPTVKKIVTTIKQPMKNPARSVQTNPSSTYEISTASETELPETPAASGGNSAKTSAPSDQKVKASVTVDSKNRKSAEEILSPYESGDGSYEISVSDFNKVQSQLNEIDASIYMKSEETSNESQNETAPTDDATISIELN